MWLVSGKEQVVVQLTGYAAGDVLAAVGEHAACVELLLEAAVVDAYAQVAERHELLQRELRRFKGVCYAQLFKVLRLLPDVYKVRDYPVMPTRSPFSSLRSAQGLILSSPPRSTRFAQRHSASMASI